MEWNNGKNFFVDHIKAITYTVIGLILILIGGFLFLEYRDRQEKFATNALFHVRQQIDKLEKEKHVMKAVPLLESITKEQGGTYAALEAAIGIGDIYLRAKKIRTSYRMV